MAGSMDIPPESDILSQSSIGDWLVIGWFTPDYRLLAEKFAANLDEHNVPFHLFFKHKLSVGWNTWRKPSVVLEAMEMYRNKIVVLMDVDCVVRSDIAWIKDISGEVGLAISSRRVRLLWPMHKRNTIKASSRVVVFRPTEGAKTFAAEWAEKCKQSQHQGDEVAMLQAYLARPGLAYTHLTLNDCAIRHESAHDRKQVWTAKGCLKVLERRFFRTGRTKLAKKSGT